MSNPAFCASQQFALFLSADITGRLPDGSSIHAISSLLLQLIQASAFGVSARIRKLRSSVMETEGPAPQSNVIDTAEEEIRFCADITESSLKSVRIVAGYLVQKYGFHYLDMSLMS